MKNPTEWRATLPLGGLAAVQYSPKFSQTHLNPQGRRGAGRLPPSPGELRHKYNARFIPLYSNEVRVDCHLLLESFATNTMCAPSHSAVTGCGSTAARPWGASPQIQGMGRLLPPPSELCCEYRKLSRIKIGFTQQEIHKDIQR